MRGGQAMSRDLSAELLLDAYASGVFPMAQSRDDPEIFWVEPRMRGVLPMNRFHIARSLARNLRRMNVSISFDADFDEVVAGCADRPETWINDTITALYVDLFRRGHAHSIEVRQDGDLVGGVYGVTIGAAFFGESMFSRRTDASKVALAFLVDRLRMCGFKLFDTQFLTPHLERLGAIEIPAALYMKSLRHALRLPARFDPDLPVPSPDQMLQRMTQIS